MVFEKIRGIIIRQTGKTGITMETNFRRDLGADSLDLFQIISDIEDTFNVRIEDAEIITTVGDAVRHVENYSVQLKEAENM